MTQDAELKIYQLSWSTEQARPDDDVDSYISCRIICRFWPFVVALLCLRHQIFIFTSINLGTNFFPDGLFSSKHCYTLRTFFETKTVEKYLTDLKTAS